MGRFRFHPLTIHPLTVHPLTVHPLTMHPQHSSPHHSLDDDDLGAQGLADGEDGHQAEAEDDVVDAEEDLPRVEQLCC